MYPAAASVRTWAAKSKPSLPAPSSVLAGGIHAASLGFSLKGGRLPDDRTPEEIMGVAVPGRVENPGPVALAF